MKAMSREQAVSMGFSPDNRKRRRAHRRAAKNLLSQGGFFNGYSARGSTFRQVALWHLEQARALS
jgi:hypothetical protein